MRKSLEGRILGIAWYTGFKIAPKNNNNNNNSSSGNQAPGQSKKTKKRTVKRKPYNPNKRLTVNDLKSLDLKSVNQQTAKISHLADGYGPKSQQGLDRGYFRTSLGAKLDHAVDTLFEFSGQYNGVVAPSDVQSAEAFPTTQMTSLISLPNPNGVSTNFASVVVHQLHPELPLWQSTATTVGLDQTVLEAFGDGRCWGLIYRKSQRLAQLSNFQQVNGESGHMWILNNSNVGTQVRFQTTNSALVTVHTAPFTTGVWTTSASAATVTVALSTVDQYYMFIEVENTNGSDCQIAISVIAGAVNMATGGKFNLLATTPSGWSTLDSSEASVRVNSGAVVMTNCENQFQASGTVLTARVNVSAPPEVGWDSFLFQQPQHYMGKWKLGAFFPLFGTTPNGAFIDCHKYPTNQLASPNMSVNVAFISSTLYAAADQLQVQTKLSQWTDFKNSEAAYPKIKPEYSVLWPKIIALANAHTVPTDNPDHLDAMRNIKKAVKYIALNPDANAQQIRNLIKMVGSAALKAAPMLAELAATLL